MAMMSFRKSALPTWRGEDLGYCLVVDGTRRATLETAMVLHSRRGRDLAMYRLCSCSTKPTAWTKWEIDQATIEAYSHKG